MKHWLVKSEPETFSWADLVKEGVTAWTGVRNYQARNNLRSMRKGDLALFYHSGAGREIVGVARVARVAYPDPTSREGDWSCVDIAHVRPLDRPVGLQIIKADLILGTMTLVKNSRLSVSPLTGEQLNRVLELARSDE
jgi:predicted RNA-binding protein with PUA-like domain